MAIQKARAAALGPLFTEGKQWRREGANCLVLAFVRHCAPFRGSIGLANRLKRFKRRLRLAFSVVLLGFCWLKFTEQFQSDEWNQGLC